MENIDTSVATTEEIIVNENDEVVIRTTTPEQIIPQKIVDVPFDLDEAKKELADLESSIGIQQGIYAEKVASEKAILDDLISQRDDKAAIIAKVESARKA